MCLMELVLLGAITQRRVRVTHDAVTGSEQPAHVVETLDEVGSLVRSLDGVVDGGVPQLPQTDCHTLATIAAVHSMEQNAT
eukprot:CAMPEP_0196719848 /NCGR_PEP_ID=MMETSP1091-20130531/2769_1 /TAXON_ID=302021 /ORGANISM="Rhodomonas sp., Strain CCMP768" /LENGTH=80 /DNA_ID=CAMNT_0042060917 /DNA_START=53 /DNA_END=295 /DNA_ORIENTATION=-